MKKRELMPNKKYVTSEYLGGTKKEDEFKGILNIIESSKKDIFRYLRDWVIIICLSIISLCLLLFIIFPKSDLIQIILFGSNLFIGLTAIIISINPYKEERKRYKNINEIILKFKRIYKLLEYDLIAPKEHMIGDEKPNSSNFYFLRIRDGYLFENNSKKFYKLGYNISEIEPLFWNVLNLRIDNHFIGNFMWEGEISFSNDEWKINVYNGRSKIDKKSGGLSIYSKKFKNSFNYRNPIENIKVKEEFLEYYLNHVLEYTFEYLKDYLKDKRYSQLLELIKNNLSF